MQFNLNWQNDYIKDCSPNFVLNKNLPRHRWYEFKEGFSAGVVRRAIHDNRKHNKSSYKILDPFSGSGTTALVALENGCQITAIEVNPFMDFVGRAKCKTTAKNESELKDSLNKIIKAAPFEIESPLEEQSTFTQKDGLDKWLFNRSVLRGYEALRMHIIEYMEEPEPFLLALFSAVMDCSNAKRDGKCLRYKKDWKTMGYSSLELRSQFVDRAIQTINDIQTLPLVNSQGTFINADSRTALQNLKGDMHDLVIFSPPYLNSFDYNDVYRPELFLGRFVSNNDELRELRGKTLRSHVQYNWEQCDRSGSKRVSELASQVRSRVDSLWNKKIPDMIESYFADMEKVLYNSYKAARPGASMWIIVSTSAYAGIEIPVDLLLAELSTLTGWYLDGVHVLRNLRSASQHAARNESEVKSGIRLRESLILCKK